MNEIGKDKLLNKLEEKNILTGNDINLLKMYKEKDINLEKFINLFRLKLSEYMGYKINVLGQAYLCINKLSKNSPKYIREYK